MTDLISELTTALGLAAGSRAAALDRLWSALPADDHAGRCIVAHYAADQQASVDDEIAWDELALAESAQLTDDALAAIQPGLTVESFLPSLYLNVADGYRRARRFDQAAAQLELGRAHLGAFDDAPPEQSGYIEMIRGGYARAADLIDRRSSATAE
ncbi:hypothetical protein [Gordonia neofelifaecis]|uniref:Uncharacterized protein n=1 Tax=Gordonia neofelifaecis NRRL B-59395 TaxID=644548 RepID=F1YEH1_9ACTN|nr:hypothetical protein [Gordonia neofelifaecis]EGD56804.1 hypothetical protein SCNU_00460 [Gordonia neofelifaecis NRRL B-59395]